MACDRSPGEGEGRGWRPLTRGCHEVTGDDVKLVIVINPWNVCKVMKKNIHTAIFWCIFVPLYKNGWDRRTDMRNGSGQTGCCLWC